MRAQSTSKIEIQTSGKVILFGEHSVVYGYPAIACAIENALCTTVETTVEAIEGIQAQAQAQILFDFRILHLSLLITNQDLMTADFETRWLDQPTDQRLLKAILKLLSIFGITHLEESIQITVTGDLPIGVGLGSSASLSIGLVKAFAHLSGLSLSKDQINTYTLALESCFHEQPSGLDQHVILNQGAWRFQKRVDGHAHVRYDLKRLVLKHPLYFVIAWVPRRGDTLKAVQMVRAKREQMPDLMDGLFEQMGKVAQRAEMLLETSTFDLLPLLFELNHGYLNACGLSTSEIEKIIEISKQSGAKGAKLTGAGLGGSVLILCEQERQSLIVDALRQNHFSAISTKIDLS